MNDDFMNAAILVLACIFVGVVVHAVLIGGIVNDCKHLGQFRIGAVVYDCKERK